MNNSKVISRDEWYWNQNNYIYKGFEYDTNNVIVYDKEDVPDKIWEIFKVLEKQIKEAMSMTGRYGG